MPPAKKETPPPRAEGPEPELLTIPQVAQILGVHRVTVHRIIGDGRLRTVNVLGRRRIARREVDRFLAGRS